MQKDLIRIRNFAFNIINRYKNTECFLSDEGRKLDIEDAYHIIEILEPLIHKCKYCESFEVACDSTHEEICRKGKLLTYGDMLACEDFKIHVPYTQVKNN